MATALQLVTRAMRLIGSLGKGEIADDDEGVDGLAALNTMLDSWQIERLLVYQIVQNSHTWAAATTSRTIGSGGNFAVQRPVRIEAAWYRDSNNQDYPLEVLRDRNEYDSIPVKSTTGNISQYLFYDPVYPLGVLYAYPISTPAWTLKLNTWQTLQSFSALTTDLALPPGYQRAIEYNLAIEMAPEYGKGASMDPQIIAVALQSKSAIKTLNAPSMAAQLDSGAASLGQTAGGRYSIYSDS